MIAHVSFHLLDYCRLNQYMLIANENFYLLTFLFPHHPTLSRTCVLIMGNVPELGATPKLLLVLSTITCRIQHVCSLMLSA